MTVRSTSVDEDTGSASGSSSSTGGSASTGSGSSGVFTSCAGGSLVVTGVFDGHGGYDSARYAHKAMLDLVANDSALHQSLGKRPSDTATLACACRSWRVLASRVCTTPPTEFQGVRTPPPSPPDQALATPRPPAPHSSQPTGAHRTPPLSPSHPLRPRHPKQSTTARPCCHPHPPPSPPPHAACPYPHTCSLMPPLRPAPRPAPPRSKVDEAILGLARQRAAAGRPHEYADGTTALLALQLGGLLAVANAGDSRAVLSREGQVRRRLAPQHLRVAWTYHCVLGSVGVKRYSKEGALADAASPLDPDRSSRSTPLHADRLCSLAPAPGPQAVRLSRDHTPALRSERQRIEAAGGTVMVARGAARVVMPRKDAPDVMRVRL